MTTGPHELRTEEFATLIDRLSVLPRIENDAVSKVSAWNTSEVHHFSTELLGALEASRNGLRTVARRDDQEINAIVKRAYEHLAFARMADRSPWMWDALFGMSAKETW